MHMSEKIHEEELSSPTSNDDLKELTTKNIQWTMAVYEQNKKIKRRLTMMVFLSYFKIAIILIPLILGIIFLPPLVTDFTNQIQDFISGGFLGSASNSGIDINQILKSIQ